MNDWFHVKLPECSYLFPVKLAHLQIKCVLKNVIFLVNMNFLICSNQMIDYEANLMIIELLRIFDYRITKKQQETAQIILGSDFAGF